MTHDELLEEIDRYLVPTLAESVIGNKAIGILKALRAVVELHYEYSFGKDSLMKNICSACSKPYPCLTIEAIEKELNDGLR